MVGLFSARSAIFIFTLQKKPIPVVFVNFCTDSLGSVWYVTYLYFVSRAHFFVAADVILNASFKCYKNLDKCYCCFSDVISTVTSNDSDRSDKTLIDVSILSFHAAHYAFITAVLGHLQCICRFSVPKKVKGRNKALKHRQGAHLHLIGLESVGA